MCVCVLLSQRAALTSVSVVKVDKLLPLIMVQETENSSSQTRPHLDDKLHVSVDGEAGCNEGGVQRPAEGGQRVHGLSVVEAEDGVNSPGELRADWRQTQVHKQLYTIGSSFNQNKVEVPIS